MLSHLKQERPLNLAPCIDFLFILLVIFATAAISREVIRSHQVELAQVEGSSSSKQSPNHQALIISINSAGNYIWNGQLKDYPMPTIQAVVRELKVRKKSSALKNQLPPVYLRIDAIAPWEKIATLLTAIEQEGFEAYPLLEEKPAE